MCTTCIGLNHVGATFGKGLLVLVCLVCSGNEGRRNRLPFLDRYGGHGQGRVLSSIMSFGSVTGAGHMRHCSRHQEASFYWNQVPSLCLGNGRVRSVTVSRPSVDHQPNIYGLYCITHAANAKCKCVPTPDTPPDTGKLASRKALHLW